MIERTIKVTSVGLKIVVCVPIEIARQTAIVTSIIPLLLFSGGEYIATEKQTYTEMWADYLGIFW